MTTQTEALKLALDALEELNNTNSYWWQEVDEQTIKKIEPTITAIKEALAQPEHEPVAFLTNHRQRMNVQIKPEAFVWMPTTTDWEVPLYTTPPQRTWVGLTDEEMDQWIEEEHDVLRWAEAKLKEKNT